MSAKTQIKTNLQDKEILKEALGKLNINFTEHNADAQIKDYYHNVVSAKGDLLVGCKGHHDEVGFARNAEGNFELLGDTHYERGLFQNAKSAVGKVTQHYTATQVALAFEENSMFSIETSNLSDVNADEIVIEATVEQ